MIPLTHLNGREFILNADLIRTVESTPDTLVVLTGGDKLMVRESPAEIVARVLEWRREQHRPPVVSPPPSGD